MGLILENGPQLLHVVDGEWLLLLLLLQSSRAALKLLGTAQQPVLVISVCVSPLSVVVVVVWVGRRGEEGSSNVRATTTTSIVSTFNQVLGRGHFDFSSSLHEHYDNDTVCSTSS